MAAYKLLRLLALALVAIVALSASPIAANALVADREHVARHAHNAVARRKRSDSSTPSSPGRCQPPSSSDVPTPTPDSPPTAPSSTSSAPPPGPTTSTKKRGIAWTSDPELLAQWDFQSIEYLYNWGVTIPSPLPNGWQGVPMLWGWKDVNNFQSTVVEGYANHVLGPNEPNEPGQSNMSADDGLRLWMTYINPLKDQGYRLGSAACTDDDDGKKWYTDFFNGCWHTPGCKVDFVAFHAYNTDPYFIIEYANWLHNFTQLPVWFTEIAAQDYSGANQQADPDQINAFVDVIKAFVDETEWVEILIPFGVMTTPYLDGVNPLDGLMNDDGSPNALARRWYE